MEAAPSERIGWAFVAAPLVGAAVLAGVAAAIGEAEGATNFALAGLVLVGFPATALFGLPIYLALRGWAPLRLWTAVPAGALTAVAPFLLAMATAPLQPHPEGVMSVVANWASMAAMALAPGAAGGAAFWFVAAWTLGTPRAA